MSNYLVFLDTGERRSKSPGLCRFCKKYSRMRELKLKGTSPLNIDKELGRFTSLRGE
jgi:hypothetical protein